MKNKLRDWGLAVFSIDLRSLALFRLGVSIAVIANVLILLPEWQTFLSDDGLYTRADSMERLTPFHFSLYYLLGASWFSFLLLALTLLSALAMLFGWHTRIATCVTWVLVLSLSNRISGLTSLADVQLSILLFWAMFLPLGARFSIDSALATEKKDDNRYFSVATVAILLQVLYLYFIGALLKTGSFWVETHEAIHFSLTSVQITSPLAPMLAEYPEVMRWLTIYVYYLELFAILFLFAPVLFQYARLFVLPQLVALHVGFALFLSIGIFPLVSIAGLMVFLPAMFWERSLKWWNGRRTRRGIAIYYDRPCTFCLKTCLVFRELSLPSGTPVLEAQGDSAARKILEQENTWVVRTHDGRMLRRWDAVSYIWRRSPLLWPLGVVFSLPFLKHLGNALYDLIANNRDALGRLTARAMPFRQRAIFWLNRKTSMVLILMTILVFLWNVDRVTGYFYFPEKISPLMWSTGLSQHWRMFAPQPLHVSEWVVIEGSDEDGGRLDLLRGRDAEPVHEKPRHGYQAFPNYRWRKYFSRVDFEEDLERLGRFYCRRAEEKGLGVVQSVRIFHYRKPGVRPDAETREVTLVSSLQYPCESG